MVGLARERRKHTFYVGGMKRGKGQRICRSNGQALARHYESDTPDTY